MNKEYCEKVRLSVMAICDNEKPLIAAKEIDKHLASCSDCRAAIEQLQETVNYFDGKQRKTYEVNVLEAVENTLQESSTIKEDSKYLVHFVILGLVLIILKIVGMSPAFNNPFTVKTVSIFVIIIFFFLIKQNPFSIEHNLQMKGD